MVTAPAALSIRLRRLELSGCKASNGAWERAVAAQMAAIEQSVRNLLGDEYMDNFKPDPSIADQSVPLEVRLAKLLAD